LICKKTLVLVEELSLFNFKSYSHRDFVFEPGINCIVGENGSGKSNLLDALHVICLTKSGFGASDSEMVRHGEEAFAVRALVKEQKILCSYSAKGKKVVVGDYTCLRLADYVGQNRCVLVCPADQAIVEEGSELRRKFFDMAISQCDSLYLRSLSRYNSLLKQRNALLKSAQETQRLDRALLEAYTLPLAQETQFIREKRATFLEQFCEVFKERHQRIAQHSREADIHYIPDLEGDPIEVFQRNLRLDTSAGRTTQGIHKDEFKFELQGYPIKKFGSQGQIKTFALSLKLALYELYEGAILLLDDIFDKLDDTRIASILGFLAEKSPNQFFLTDARAERSHSLLKQAGLEAHFIEV
jgi:DNA replication and repair protein RecF